MKRIFEHTCHRVVSEPGDHTRYEYIVIQKGNQFMFVPWKNSFPYPAELISWQVKKIETWEDAAVYIKENPELDRVNPHTLLECVRTIKLLLDYEKKKIQG